MDEVSSNKDKAGVDPTSLHGSMTIYGQADPYARAHGVEHAALLW
jgi:hypothetical protein